jgi:hypothetical protein
MDDVNNFEIFIIKYISSFDLKLIVTQMVEPKLDHQHNIIKRNPSLVCTFVGTLKVPSPKLEHY